MTVIEKIKNLKFYNLINDLKEILLYGNRPYKSYVATLYQALGGVVVTSELENTIGEISIIPLGGGEYSIVSDKKFKVGSTTINYNPLYDEFPSTISLKAYNYQVVDESTIRFATFEDGELSDNTMAYSPIEIRVY